MDIRWPIHSMRQAALNTGRGARDGRGSEVTTMGRLG